MNVGFVGLGKLGLPVALAVERAGHAVLAVDPGEEPARILRDRKTPHLERGVDDLLATTRIRIVSADGLVRASDLVFVAVQTPHDPMYEGVTPVPDTRRDFDTRTLVRACEELATAAKAADRQPIVAVISTVLPGTVRRLIKPVFDAAGLPLVYNPSFIAMGEVLGDFVTPEFVLLGGDDDRAAAEVERFYRTIVPAETPVARMSIDEAELTKVLYNVFIGIKIVFGNYVGEICDRTRTDADRVIGALRLATRRLMSGAYLTPGMGDAGGCHPRDQIALSWIGRELGLSVDLADFVARARETQTRRQADLIVAEHRATGLPIVILGQAFKPETNLTTGSAAALLAWILRDRGYDVTHFDPRVDSGSPPQGRALYFIATRHPEFADWPFTPGSVVLDPFGYVADGSNVRVERIGRRPHP